MHWVYMWGLLSTVWKTSLGVFSKGAKNVGLFSCMAFLCVAFLPESSQFPQLGTHIDVINNNFIYLMLDTATDKVLGVYCVSVSNKA